ncbi:MAG: hypothetical protein ACHREM_12545 [Polyangiales bacterium]
MPRRVAPFASLASFAAVTTRLALSASLVLGVGAVASLTGCEDPRSIEWQLKHLEDTNPIDRSKAIEGVSQQWRNVEQTSDKDDDAKKKKGDFAEKVIPEIAKAYTSDALKDSGKDRKKLMDILAAADDPKAKPAFVQAIKSYKPGENDDEVKAATRAVGRMAKSFKGDDELAKALLTAFKAVKFADRRSGELGALFGDTMGAIKAKSIAKDLLAIVTSPNSGDRTPSNLELAGHQAIAAQTLGDLGDDSMVGTLIDTMFDLASKVVVVKDASGNESQSGSPVTGGIAQVISGSLAKIGQAAIDPLMPYVKDDSASEAVKKVREKFKGYIAGGGSQPKAYVGLATTTVANIGLPQVTAKVAGIVRDPKTKDDDRKPLIGLMVSMPLDADGEAALKEGYAASTSNETKGLIAGSVSRTMDPAMTDWLLAIAADGKADETIKTGALTSALWLAPKDKMASVKIALDKAKLSDKPDPAWRVMDPTDKTCDPAKAAEKDHCGEHPDKKDKSGKPVFIQWEDKTPKYGEEIATITELTDKCGDDAKCYFEAFKTAVAEVDKQGFTKVTLNGTKAGMRAQKAIWMLAAYGKEDDMVKLVQMMPNIESPAPRQFVQMALDRNLKTGSTKVADQITKLVKGEREKGSETANREAAQLEPIANKLRARVGAKK